MSMNQTRTPDIAEYRVMEPEKVRAAQRSLLAEETYGDLAEIFRALGDASRSKIIYTLLRQEMCVCDIAAVV